MEENLPYIIPAVLTAIFNYIFYLLIKNRVDSSIEKYKISYSGVFKEKIDIYKILLEKIYDLRIRLNQYQIMDDEDTKNNLRGEFNSLIRMYLIHRPFLSEHLIDLFKNMTQELQSVYEAFVLGSLRNYGNLNEDSRKQREQEYWKAVNKLRNGNVLNEIESNIIDEIRKDLNTITKS